MAFGILPIAAVVLIVILAVAFLIDWRAGAVLILALAGGAAILFLWASQPRSSAPPAPKPQDPPVATVRGIPAETKSQDPANSADSSDEEVETASPRPISETGE